MSTKGTIAATAKDQLIGTWRVASFTATSGDTVSYPLGEKPGGYVGFAQKSFWTMIFDSTRQAPTGTLSDADAAAQMKSSAAYTGIYSIEAIDNDDGVKLTIHVDAAANQSLVGTDRVFFVRARENELTLKSPSVVVAMTGQPSVVELEFVRAE